MAAYPKSNGRGWFVQGLPDKWEREWRDHVRYLASMRARLRQPDNLRACEDEATRLIHVAMEAERARGGQPLPDDKAQMKMFG